MFTHDPRGDKPCPQMRSLDSALTDDALSGLGRWYTMHHVAGCSQCSAALAYYQAPKTCLHLAAALTTPLTPDRWTAAETACEEADREVEAKPGIVQ